MTTTSAWTSAAPDSTALLPNGCWTIDHTTTDNGFLGCARGGVPGAGSHGSTADAVQNLLNCLGPTRQSAHIVGHGNDGIIVTGTGQNANDRNKYVSLWNQTNWQAALQRLNGRINDLRLWACHPGTADAGADFLYNVARVVGAAVAGPTGFLYCSGGNLTLEPRSTWQVATPTSRPPAIAAPTPHLQVLMKLAISMQGKISLVDLKDVSRVHYKTFAFMTGGAHSTTLTGDDGRDLLRLIDLEHPFQPPGIPAALVTGELEVTFTASGQEHTRSFNIYNDRLLHDPTEDVYYNATAAFTTALMSV
jgi:hypothetical protein